MQPDPSERAPGAHTDSAHGTSRRCVLAAAGGSLLLAGCGSAQDSASSTPTSSSAGSSAATSSSSASTSSASAPAGSADAIVALADVPVGGAVSAKLAGKPIIVAQPTAGAVKAFSAVCPHQGCTVVPSGAKLDCPCHGSVFDALTGAVEKGPAASDLPAVAVAVSGTSVVAS